jgi:hypothetical protein
MPVYVFEEVVRESKPGTKRSRSAAIPQRKRIERAYPMDKAPRIGETIVHDGKVWVRIAAPLQVDDGSHRTYPYVSRSLPRNLKGCGTNAQGMPIIRSRSHEADVAARHNLVRD